MSAGVLKYTLVVRHPDTDAPTALLVGEAVPAWARDLVHADDVDGDAPTGYGDLKVPELKDEIAKRNEGREEADLIPSDGNKADLVKALEGDDKAQADKA